MTQYEKIRREIMKDDIARLATFPAQNPDPIFEVNLSGKITYANRAALNYFPGLLMGSKKHSLIKDILKNINHFINNKVKSIVIETRIGKRIYEQHLWYFEKEKRIRSYVHDNTQQKKIEEEIAWNLNTQKALNSILRITLENISLDELLNKALEIILSLPWLSFEKKGCIFIVQNNFDTLNMVASKGLEEQIQNACRKIPIGECLCGRAAKIGKLQFASHFDNRHKILSEGIREHGHYCVPILVSNKVIGVLNVYLKAKHRRDQREEYFLKTVAGLLGLITEHKKNEETLRARERMLAHAQRIAHMGTWSWDVKNNKIVWSDETYRIFGVNKDDFKGSYEEFLAFVHPDDLNRVKRKVTEALRGDNRYEIEHRIIRGDGKELILSERADVVFDAERKPLRMIGVVRDITEEKATEKLKENLINLRKALINATLIISEDLDFEEIIKKSLSAARHLTGANYAAFALLENKKIVNFYQDGLSDDEINNINNCPEGKGLIGKMIFNPQIFRIDDLTEDPDYEGFPESHPTMGPLLSVPVKRGDNYIGVLYLTKDKEETPFSEIDEEIVKSFSDHIAVAIFNAKLYQDVKDLNENLEKRVAEATVKIKEALKRAEAASKAKSSFLANMSHELRTPLNAIIGFAEILKEEYFGTLNEKQSEYLNDILESAHHLLTLINDVLDLSQIESGRTTLDREDIYVSELIERSLVMIREKALKHGIKLKTEIPEKLKKVKVSADRRKLKQVMFNLLSNAVKYTPDGGTITVRGNIKGKEVSISVEDTGVGITSENRERIFEEFFQVESQRSGKPEGTGLGLSITKQIVEMHGGKIWVVSTGKGKGSRFTFTLPV